MERYSIIESKNKREIVLLRGKGCIYRKCIFCDYYNDSSDDENENFKLNKAALDRVTGKYGKLEVINSGSVFELDKNTIEYIKKTCMDKKITTIHFEAHYIYKDRIKELRDYFDGFDIKMKLGLESFDYELREGLLNKGIKERNAKEISKNFNEANFLFGICGQNVESMKKDIDLGLKHFERICINIMNKNSTGIKPDLEVIALFKEQIYPDIKDNKNIDVLIDNTDFGVGE